MWSEAKPCPELIWFATNKCPLNCLYCCVGDDNVDAFGNFLACLFTNLTVGNIKEKTLPEIWAEVISSPPEHDSFTALLLIYLPIPP
jgi:hypothetical protein